jgi:small-conductance mechanosensitive channel
MTEDTKQIVIPIAACLASVAIFLLIRFIAFALVHRSPRIIQSLKIAVRVTRFPSLLWCIIGGLRVGTEFWRGDDHLTKITNLLITILTIASITVAVSRTLQEIVTHYLGRIGSALSNNGLIRGVIAGLSFMMGGLILLSQLGIRIEPLLTALGVGGLAVSLALQDTLSNVFAGIALLIDRSILIGDPIKLENGMEGTVLDIGWRTTRLQTNTNDQMVVPNIKLAQNISIRKNALTPRT